MVIDNHEVKYKFNKYNIISVYVTNHPRDIKFLLHHPLQQQLLLIISYYYFFMLSYILETCSNQCGEDGFIEEEPLNPYDQT